MANYHLEHQNSIHIWDWNFAHLVAKTLKMTGIQCALFSKLKQQLAAITSKHFLHTSMLTTFLLGLLAIRHDTPYPDTQDNLLPVLCNTI